MIDVLEIIKATESQSCIPILDTLIKSKQEYQFYFYSLLKKKILRKKSGKVDYQFAIDILKKNVAKEIQSEMILVQFLNQQDKKAKFRIASSGEGMRLVESKNENECWMFAFLERKKEESQLIKAVWTGNYCICSQFTEGQWGQKKSINLSISIKQTIGVICMDIAKTASRSYRQTVKKMDIVFLKLKKTNKLYFLFCQDLSLEERTVINLSFIRIESSEEEGELPLVNKQAKCSYFFICSSCNATNSTQFKQIPQHSVYRLQLKYSTAKRSISQKRNTLLEKYNSVKICPPCYQKYMTEVKRESKYLQQTKPRSVHSIDLRNISIQCPKEKIEKYSGKLEPQTTKNYRVYSESKFQSNRSQSTKLNAFDSIMNFSNFSRKQF